MILKTLALYQFRNFSRQAVSFAAGVNVIWGKNGQGKTNLLEAVHILAFTRSMRNGSERDWLQFGTEEASLYAQTSELDRDNTLEMQFRKSVRRRLAIDGVPVDTAKGWIGHLPIVFFGPQELALIQEGPTARRRFMDMALCQMLPRYTQALTLYKKALEHKAKILRGYHEKPTLVTMLPEFNRQLAETGAYIMLMRQKFVKALAIRAGEHHLLISGGREHLTMEYKTSVALSDTVKDMIEALYEKFDSRTEQELQAGATLVGPHRDELRTYIDGHEARVYASQGQTRTAALALKMAERDVLEESLQTTPILLLDDVLSELDVGRRSYILQHQVNGQILITDCEPARLAELQTGKKIEVSQGQIVSEA